MGPGPGPGPEVGPGPGPGPGPVASRKDELWAFDDYTQFDGDEDLELQVTAPIVAVSPQPSISESWATTSHGRQGHFLVGRSFSLGITHVK